MMKSNVAIVNKNIRFNNGVELLHDSEKNKLGSYGKDRINMFRKKMIDYLGRIYDIYVDFDDAINGVLDDFADRLIDGYENLEESLKKESVTFKKDAGSVYDKLQPMMSEDEFRRIGIDIDNEESIAELQEFKKELMMGNFPQAMQTKKNSGPVRRLVPKRDINSRGSFNIWTTILVGSLFLGLFAILVFACK